MAVAIKKRIKGKVKDLSIDRGQYVKAIGYVLSKHGNKSAKRFYLGPVSDGPEAARLKAAELAIRWKALVATGAKVWTVDPFAAPDSPEAPSEAGKATAATIGEGAKLYIAGLMQRVLSADERAEGLSGGGSVTISHVRSQKGLLARAMDFIPAGTEWKDIDEMLLSSAVIAIGKRPLKKPRRFEDKDNKQQRMSKVSAKNIQKALKWFLLWASDNDYFDAPKRFEKIFKQNTPVSTEAEQIAAIANGGGDDNEHFELSDLKLLYKHAGGGSDGLMILLALNCGFANMELATLKKHEIKGLDTPAPYIERFRQKTNVYGKWQLWPETAELLRKFLAPDTLGGLALCTFGGKSLVEEGETRRRDGVRSRWEWLYRKCPQGEKAPKRLSFKFLRKTGADLIRNRLGYGLEISECYLAHTEEGQNKEYANRPWARLAEATEALRAHLQPMFDKE